MNEIDLKLYKTNSKIEFKLNGIVFDNIRKQKIYTCKTTTFSVQVRSDSLLCKFTEIQKILTRIFKSLNFCQRMCTIHSSSAWSSFPLQAGR